MVDDKRIGRSLLVTFGTMLSSLLLAGFIATPEENPRTQTLLVFACLTVIVLLLRWENHD